MKEPMYAVPVLDAFRADTECPFCRMRAELEKDSIAYMLGSSYMDDKVRMATNEAGFCAEHYAAMFAERNRLGLGLMLETHMRQVIQNIEKLPEKKLAEYLKKVTGSCYVCERIETHFTRYAETFFYLWKHDPSGELKKLVEHCKGFCLSHFAMLLTLGEKELGKAEREKLIAVVLPLEMENLKRVGEDVSWFVKKFDYQNADAPWKNAKDALPRGILKMASTEIKTEPIISK